jgi:cellulose biosynthesis protein BcsQ
VDSILELLRQCSPFVVPIASIATIVGFLFTLYKAIHTKQTRFLNDQIKVLQRQLEQYQGEDPESMKQLITELTAHLDEAKECNNRLGADLATAKRHLRILAIGLRSDRAKAADMAATFTAQIEAASERLSANDQANLTRKNLVKKALMLEGRVWERKVLNGVPAFAPLHERHVAIFSILNLKGGVGKTTITANLGAAMAASGYRVLMVDLDLQGSLSSLFVNESVLRQRSADESLLQHFLLRRAENNKASLLQCAVPVFDGKSAVIATADSLAYAELNLTMRWLLRIGKRDNRFLLRKALHQKRITNRYDVILLDCPPLFNTCCINALAASDYVIIPVLPSQKAAERVPQLLSRLKSLSPIINPDLHVAGVLLNRTHGDRLTVREADLWRDMLDKSQDQWKLPVHAFKTFIRQTTEVRDTETEFTAPRAGSELHTTFSRLVAELEERMPRDCRRSAAIPFGSE